MVARILTALSILTIVGSFVCLGTQGGGAHASQLAAQKAADNISVGWVYDADVYGMDHSRLNHGVRGWAGIRD